MPSTLTADTAVSSARAALWTWDAVEGVLHIRGEPGSGFSRLDGDWSLEAFLGQVDGLARPHIRARLEGGLAGDSVDVRTNLSDGQPAHFIGTFHDMGLARGLIVSGQQTSRTLADSNVEPVFQPIRRLSDMAVAGFEALARFRTPDGRLVGPESLLAEAYDTDWSTIAPNMLARSALALSALRREGRNVFMQVNLSAAEIARPDLVEILADIIREADLPAGTLRVELTEQAALRDYEGALGALAAFRAAGAGVVLDDFGGGHSSFAWLAEIPADGVKLDPKLCRMIAQPRACRIVTALAAMVRGLGMAVTAEGIENRALSDELAAIGFDYVQGFAFDMPLRGIDLATAFDRSG